MLLSVFTPTHDPTHLHELWNCLRAQTYPNWEWVVVPNGPNAESIVAAIQRFSVGDSRVRIVPHQAGNVGALKRFACDNCRGDLFVEVDHDDLITPDCLAALAALVASPESELFAFSETVTCFFDGQSQTFYDGYGWKHTKWAYEGREYIINRAFPVTARSLCDILFAPDHIRAWSRAAYAKAGGHNPTLRVGDDHELVVRTFLEGVPFEFINRPLYIHRLKPKTTSQTSLDEIAGVSRQTQDTYLHRLVAEWCRRERLPIHDLNPADLAALELLSPNSVGCFRAFDVLQAIPATIVPRLMNVLYDKLVPCGWLLTATPTRPVSASIWSANSFQYYTHRARAVMVPQNRCRFQMVRQGTIMDENGIPRVFADLCAVKADPHPGPIEI